MSLEKELATYQQHREELLAHEGKFVLIVSNVIDSLHPTYEQALTAGYEKYGLSPFLVKKIERVETEHFIGQASRLADFVNVLKVQIGHSERLHAPGGQKAGMPFFTLSQCKRLRQMLMDYGI